MPFCCANFCQNLEHNVHLPPRESTRKKSIIAFLKWAARSQDDDYVAVVEAGNEHGQASFAIEVQDTGDNSKRYFVPIPTTRKVREDQDYLTPPLTPHGFSKRFVRQGGAVKIPECSKCKKRYTVTYHSKKVTIGNKYDIEDDDEDDFLAFEEGN